MPCRTSSARSAFGQYGSAGSSALAAAAAAAVLAHPVGASAAVNTGATVVGLHGMDGLGKTTLARSLYDDADVDRKVTPPYHVE